MLDDSKLYSTVMDKLEFEPYINASKITVGVRDGIVTLEGAVSSYPEKRAVERAIMSLSGVKAVANELKVSIIEAHKRTDAEIAKAAINAIEWHALVPPNKTRLVVENGYITLTGEVEWWYQKQSAEKAIRNLHGVTGVTNNIVVKPSKGITAEEVRSRILKEFERNAVLDSKKIEVEVSGTKLTLKGKLRSWEEIREATRAAWSIPGITQVDNQLKLSF